MVPAPLEYSLGAKVRLEAVVQKGLGVSSVGNWASSLRHAPKATRGVHHQYQRLAGANPSATCLIPTFPCST